MKKISFILLILMTSCGENQGTNPTNSFSTNSPSNSPTIEKLARIGSVSSLSVSNGNLYFSQGNNHDIHSISTNGGELKTHYSAFAVGGNVSLVNGNLYFSGLGNNGVLSVSPQNVGISRVSRIKYSSIGSVVSDETNVYWSEYSTGVGRVVKAPLKKAGIPSNFHPDGYSLTEVLPFPLVGNALLTINGVDLFILETATSKVYKVNLNTNEYTLLTTVTLQSATAGIKIASNSLFVYILDGLNLLQINKLTGAKSTVSVGIDPMLSDIKTDADSVYWWQTNSLKRLSSATGIITTLATGINDGLAFAIDSSHIWWFSVGPNFSIYKAPISMGTTQLVASYPFNQYQPPMAGSIYVDQNFIHWTGTGGVLVYKQEKTGLSAPTSLNNGSFYHGFATNSTYAIWGDNFHIRTLPLSGQPPATGVWSFIPPNSTSGIQLSVTTTYFGNNIYWSADIFDTSDPLGTYAIGIYSYDGTSTNLINKIYGSITASISNNILADNSGLILAHAINDGTIPINPFRISAISPAGGVVDIVHSDTEIIGMSLSNEVVYFIVSNGIDIGKLLSFDLNTSILKNLTSSVEPTTIAGLYADANNVYWGDPLGTHKLNLSDNTTSLVESGSHALAITGDALNIYWADGSFIKRTKK